MKKIFMVLAAVAAMVGCSKENTPMNVVEKDNVTVNASIVLDATRVSVEGENFTDVKWSEGDKIQLSSVAGTSMVMTTSEISESRDQAFFAGDGELVSAVDTYYAIYPVAAIADGVAKVNLAEQSGNDAAVLVAKANSTTAEGINMAFTPANALLHVAVSGIDALAKAEFKAFDGSAIASEFVYDFVSEAATAEGETEVYVVENPAVDGFFFSLPADMDMAAGYVVSLTDAEGNVCTKAYNGKTFAKGTTTRVNIEWSTPSVALGTPMTSYSYYVSGDVDTANTCANNVIYFTTASTYAGIQNAMIAEAGYVVDGVTYVSDVDTATKSFAMTQDVTVSTWGAKSVEAYIKTKDGQIYKSSTTVYITGLPYNFQFYQSTDDSVDAAGWKRNGDAKIKEKLMNLHEGGLAGSDSGWIASPGYYAPANISTTATLKAKYYVATISASGKKATLYVGTTSSNTSLSSSAKSLELSGSNNTTSSQSWSTVSTDLNLSTGVQYVSINHNKATYRLGSRIYVCNFELKYK
jgi:hypothetical protein